MRRALTLVAKSLQQLSNGVDFGKKEEFMIPMNGFITHNLELVKEYFGRMCRQPKK